jgi:hypothetical protein
MMTIAEIAAMNQRPTIARRISSPISSLLDAVEALSLERFAHERLDERDARDRKRLLRDALDLSRFSRVCLRTTYIRRPTGESGRIMSGTTAIAISEAPVQYEHRHDGRRDRGDVGDDRDERSGHDVVDVVDVVRDAVHDLAGLRVGEERDRHAVQDARRGSCGCRA